MAVGMPLAELSLAGKHALVIGAGRGIGEGIALVLAEAGADVGVVALTAANAERVAQCIRDQGRQSLALSADATRQADLDRVAAQTLAAFGTLDILVNSVGDSIRGPLVPLPGQGNVGVGLDQATWQHILDLNLTAAVLGCRAFGPHMLERRSGCIVNVSSYNVFRPGSNKLPYEAGKAALIHATKSLAVEWAPYGVRVNCVAPGLFPDPNQKTPEEMQQWLAENASRPLVKREGRLREVGLLTAFLASEAAAYITGQTVVIDGGLSLA